MDNTKTIFWEGKSEEKYEYWIYQIDTSFKEEGSNYIFAKEVEPKSWEPIYIGQTNNLNQRLENHEKERCAIEYGATHIHAHLNNNEQNRLSEEKDLIDNYHPDCND